MQKFRVRSGLDFAGDRKYWLEERGMLWGWNRFGVEIYSDSKSAVVAARHAEVAWQTVITISH